MTQETLFLLVISLSGVYTSRWVLRLAPLLSELPLKTVLATFLGGFIGVSPFFDFVVAAPVRVVALVVCPVFIFAPLLLTGVARARRYVLAGWLTQVLYWTPSGQSAMRRLLAQAALQQGDADSALLLLPEDAGSNLILIQAYALKQDWAKTLSIRTPTEGDNAFLAGEARVRAFLALGQQALASEELAQMRERWSKQGEGPIGYRSITLSEARIAASSGQVQVVQEKLQQPMQGVPTYVLFSILAEAAANAGEHDAAAKLYAQTYSLAPEGQRDVFAQKLTAYGASLPEVLPKKRSVATFALLGAIVLAYGVQLLLESRFNAVAATLTLGFLDRVQGVPDGDGWWRFLSYGFVHGNLVHIGFNAWVLFDIGRLYETRRHWGNVLASFVLGTVMGAYFSMVATSGGIPLVGASGGILGIAGALLADAWRSRAPQDARLTRSLLQWMGLIVVFSLAIPNVSLWGHVGGVIGGLLWGFTRQGLGKSRQVDVLAGSVSIALIVYVLARAAIWFMTHLSFIQSI